MDKCDVMIWNKKIGELYYINDKLKFTYIDKKIPFEISPLQLHTDTKTYDYTHLLAQKGLAGVFNDSLPDHYGEGVMNKYFASKEQDVNTIDRLLFLSNNTLGAITYEPSNNDTEAKEFQLELHNIYDEMKKVIKQKVNSDYADLEVLYSLLKSASPAGGAKTKAIIGYKDKNSPVYIGKRNREINPDYFNALIKFNTGEDGSTADNLITEYVYMKMAKKCGINTPYNELTKEKHYVIKRFDNNDGVINHMHTLQGLLHSDFATARTVDYVEAFRVLGLLNTPHDDKVELFKRMVFNFLFRNHDDHEKNISFIMNKNGDWSLSPAYDITYNYKEGGKFIGDHQLTFNGLVGNNVTYSTFEDIAKMFDIKNYKDIIDTILKNREDLEYCLLENGVSDEYCNLVVSKCTERVL